MPRMPSWLGTRSYGLAASPLYVPSTASSSVRSPAAVPSDPIVASACSAPARDASYTFLVDDAEQSTFVQSKTALWPGTFLTRMPPMLDVDRSNDDNTTAGRTA